MKGNIYTPIPSELVSVASNGIVTSADGVYDYNELKNLETINSEKADKSATVSTVLYDSVNKKFTKTINGTTTDIVSIDTLKTDISSSDTALTNTLIDTIWSGVFVTLISFTIDGVSYQAEEGMTWQEWIDSDYNVGDAFCTSTDDFIHNSSDRSYIVYSPTYGVTRKYYSIEDGISYSTLD